MEDAETTIEHAHQMSGGGYHVRWDGADKFYPLADWITATRQQGGKVYRRRIIVVEDWTEVTES